MEFSARGSRDTGKKHQRGIVKIRMQECHYVSLVLCGSVILVKVKGVYAKELRSGFLAFDFKEEKVDECIRKQIP